MDEMDGIKRICALYRHGPHYIQMLRYLREHWPEARITAMTPPGYPQEALEDLADEVLEMGRSTYRLRDLLALPALLRQIKAGRYDLFVVMFDSPKLRMLAALTRIPRRACYTIDGRYFPLELRLIRFVADYLYRNIRGRITYAYIRHVVYHRRVEK